ncbi:MAG: hypothetical protein R3B95_14705 [Nitrospirales bacterium]|nr:hypothetical protein [Nitrospirales bacterium]
MLTENDIPPNGICGCVNRERRGRSMCISMGPHLAEIICKARLEESTGCRIKRLSWRAQDVVDNRRDVAYPPASFLIGWEGSALHGMFLLSALRTFVTDGRMIATSALALQKSAAYRCKG